MAVKLRVKPNNILYLDIHFYDTVLEKYSRHKPSLGIDDTPQNRKMVEREIIPSIKREISLGTYRPKEKKQLVKSKLISEYGKQSFQRHVKERRPHVKNAYEKHFENHIIPDFGNRLIDSLSPLELLDWQNKKLEKYKASTVRKYRSILYSVFTDAVLEGILPDNPFDRVPRPSDIDEFDFEDEEDTQLRPFSLNEIHSLIDKAKGYMKNFIGIMAFTGMRPGEIVSLEWKDINFEDSLISIKRTTVYGRVGPVKTKSSKRSIEMLPLVKEYFLKQKDLTFGNPYDRVFLSSFHKPFYSHDIISSRFKDLLIEGDPRYLYNLRHSFASLMISEGEDVLWVSRMLGHKSLDITLKTYSKAYSIMQDKIGVKVRAKFLQKRP